MADDEGGAVGRMMQRGELEKRKRECGMEVGRSKWEGGRERGLGERDEGAVLTHIPWSCAASAHRSIRQAHHLQSHEEQVRAHLAYHHPSPRGFRHEVQLACLEDAPGSLTPSQHRSIAPLTLTLTSLIVFIAPHPLHLPDLLFAALNRSILPLSPFSPPALPVFSPHPPFPLQSYLFPLIPLPVSHLVVDSASPPLFSPPTSSCDSVSAHFCCAVSQCYGITDVAVKIHGSHNVLSVCKALHNALLRQETVSMR